MLYEYAVEPRAVGSDWQTFRYVIEKFGFDKGRLISQFPKHWFRDVYDASAGLLPVHKKRIEEALNQAKKNKVVRFDRTYDGALGSWLNAALAENARQPFHAIIAQSNPDGDGAVLSINDIDENDGLMAAAQECAVARDVNALATALKEFLRFGSRIVFVDPFFDPYNQGYKDVFFKFLSIVNDLNPDAVCEVHYRYHANKPCNTELEKEGGNLFKKIIPEGAALTVFCWKERPGGEDFHARYLLTDKGGARVDADFDPVGGHQTTDVALMSYDLSQMRLASVARDATAYELVEPVLRISAGKVERV